MNVNGLDERKEMDELKYIIDAMAFTIDNGCGDTYPNMNVYGVKSCKSYTEEMNEAWNLANRIHGGIENDGMTVEELIDCFGEHWASYVETHSYIEVKEMYDLWKEKKEKEFNIGDEVTYRPLKYTIIVTRIRDDFIDGININNGQAVGVPIKNCTKTGKHYPEIAKLFEGK